MIEEKRMQVFIDGVNRFFNEVNNVNAEIGTPYLVENDSPKSHDFTGIIGITGPYKGCVYFTSPRALLRHILVSIGETDAVAVLVLFQRIDNRLVRIRQINLGERRELDVGILVDVDTLGDVLKWGQHS